MKQAIVLMLILGALIAAAVAVLEIPGKTKPEVMAMTVEQIDQILRDHATKIKRSGNVWQFDVMGVPMACIVDPAHDRMRVVAPIARVSELEAGQEAAMLEANFHTMLD
ncbi:MAG: hypothetical protein KGJ55_01105, partial [Gammaproteobacteria bacterium]|nr:hypothetical protein [Gammaproteobacteria bacterium]